MKWTDSVQFMFRANQLIRQIRKKRRKKKARLLQDFHLKPKIKKREKHSGVIADEYAVLASICRESFFEFFKEFWSEISEEKLVLNWHIEYLCDLMQMMAERVFEGLPKLYDVVVNIPPGTTKPVWEETPILMGDGNYKKLKYIKEGDYVIGKSGRPCKITAVHKQGKLPSLRITTKNGRKLTTAEDHPILTTEGWKEAQDIKGGATSKSFHTSCDVLALMHKARIEKKKTRKDEEFVLAGYLIGDGSLTHGNSSFTNCTPEYQEDFIKCAKKLGYGVTSRIAQVNMKTGTIIQTFGLKNGQNCRPSRKGLPRGAKGVYAKGSIRKWLIDNGMYEKSSKTKRVPKFVWEGTNEQISKFIAAYFNCDGTVIHNNNSWSLRLGSISKGLAKDIQRLLLRLGISFNLKTFVNEKGFVYNRTLKGYKVYSVETYQANEVAKFLKTIPIKGYKKEAGEILTRSRFNEKYLGDPVVSIESAGVKECRCLTVENDHSFIANDIVVHNSSIISVAYPIWCWIRMASIQFIGASHSEDLALDLSVKSRDIVESDKFKKCFPEIKLRLDSNKKTFFKNTGKGWRYAVGVKGSVIGKHAHIIVIDDPIDPLKTLSPLSLKECNYWINNQLSNRKVNKKVTPMILVMQRLHQDDPTRLLLKRKKVYHVCLPAEETDRIRPAELADRYIRGLLDPDRLDSAVLAEEKSRGEVYYASQFLQHPVPEGGLMFKTNRIKIGPAPKDFQTVVRFWDKAGTADSGAWTVGTLMAKDRNGRFWILDVKRFRLDSFEREDKIMQTARMDGLHVLIGTEQEPGSGGKESAQATAKRLAGYRVRIIKVDKTTGGKIQRADPYSVQMNAGNVYIPEDFQAAGIWLEWAEKWVEEHSFFPNSRYKDQVDSAALAFSLCAISKVLVGGISCLDKEN